MCPKENDARPLTARQQQTFTRLQKALRLAQHTCSRFASSIERNGTLSMPELDELREAIANDAESLYDAAWDATRAIQPNYTLHHFSASEDGMGCTMTPDGVSAKATASI